MDDRRSSLDLTAAERQLLQAALELLLASERDPEMIAQLHALLARVRGLAPQAT
jgi:hypothetical protein